jgi:hypothetical protein
MLSRVKINTFLNSSTSLFTTVPVVANEVKYKGATDAFDYGNTGIRVVRGPGDDNWDMTLAKETEVGDIREGATRLFRTEFFNVWNHAQYQNSESGVGTASYGVINQSSVAPRLIEFALKYAF